MVSVISLGCRTNSSLLGLTKNLELSGGRGGECQVGKKGVRWSVWQVPVGETQYSLFWSKALHRIIYLLENISSFKSLDSGRDRMLHHAVIK